MWRWKAFAAGVVLSAALAVAGQAPAPEKPLMRDFLGLCVHTVQFKPELYKPVCRLVRDYHGLDWDLGDSTANPTTFPFARNKVDWGGMYGGWVNAGYEIDVSVMLGRFPYDQWKNPAADAAAYGLSFAQYFGPSSRRLVTSVEIGNEPGDFSDDQYRVIFENMARGLRQGDPKLKIVTCAAIAGPSHKYAKSLDCVKGLEDLYDVINVHSYAEVKGWPTWQRSCPEDPSIAYLKDIQNAIDWKNANAPGKEVWLTEFGWDSTTKENDKEGTFKDWIGNTDAQQAAWLVRSWLLFSAMDLSRAYMFWFNDEDKPAVHAASGLTRRYQPKPSFWAVSHLYATLGDYRFSRKLIERPGELFAYQYTHETDTSKTIIVAWRPAADDRTATVDIPLPQGCVTQIEQMPLTPEPAKGPDYTCKDVLVTVECSPLPLYIRIKQ
jgi:hypothetical protein